MVKGESADSEGPGILLNVELELRNISPVSVH